MSRADATESPNDDPVVLATQIVDDMMKSGAPDGERASRLVLESNGGRNLGGWGRGPLIDRIAAHLKWLRK